MTDPQARYPVTVSIPVAWGEMDAFQHVNNVVYARWLETARMVYFERLGLVKRVRDEGVGPILARTEIDYRRPVTYPDTVRVGAKVSRVGGSSFTMQFRVWSDAQGGEVAASPSRGRDPSSRLARKRALPRRAPPRTVRSPAWPCGARSGLGVDGRRNTGSARHQTGRRRRWL